MKRGSGKPEIFALIMAVLFPGIAVALTPSKSYAYLLFFLVISIFYILMKRQEYKDFENEEHERKSRNTN